VQLKKIFDGTVVPWPYLLFRTGVALLVLVRTTDVLAPVLALDHHHWVTGLEYAPWLDHTVAPVLHSPLVPFLPSLSAEVVTTLVVARTVLAGGLLVGLFPRTSAGMLALVGYGLIAVDRYRYLHHLHLLWISCAWLALVPPVGWRERAQTPRWALQLLRFQALVVYGASGLAKLRGDFLDGTTFGVMSDLHLFEGPFAHLPPAWRAPLAIGTCVTELSLVPLLAWRKTRLVGIALGLALHVGIAEAMMVSTFSVQMALYLALFLPWKERPES
jgi:hypothetical protein